MVIFNSYVTNYQRVTIPILRSFVFFFELSMTPPLEMSREYLEATRQKYCTEESRIPIPSSIFVQFLIQQFPSYWIINN